MYLGIPYAAPPVGKLRFPAPTEPDPWTDVRDATHFAPDCIQRQNPGQKFPTSEDCLYLNVYSGASSPEDRFPVLFWIYGGGFSNGRSTDLEFDGRALAALGSVVVVINCRCGAFGFFSTMELEERTGQAVNAGLLDQVQALRWVQDNIASFGGDPDRVTIFGQSAGGISCRMHLVSPASKGLFSRVQIQSGGGLNEADLVRPKAEFQALCEESLKRAAGP